MTNGNYYSFPNSWKRVGSVSIAAESHMYYVQVDAASAMKTDISIGPLSSLFFSLHSYMKLKSDFFISSVTITTNASERLYCPNNAKPRSGRISAQINGLKDQVWKTNLIFQLFGQVVFWRSWMCTQYLLLLPPCKRVEDADDACKSKQQNFYTTALGGWGDKLEMRALHVL